jgi:hypothetical protein
MLACLLIYSVALARKLTIQPSDRRLSAKYASGGKLVQKQEPQSSGVSTRNIATKQISV